MSGGNQITQIGSNRFTIPLPSVQVHDETGNHQRKDTSQAPVVNQFQVQQVSSTEEIGPYDHVTGTGHQTIQGGEYVSVSGLMVSSSLEPKAGLFCCCLSSVSIFKPLLH